MAQGVGATQSFGKGASNLRTVRAAVVWDIAPWWSLENRYHWHGYWEASGARWRTAQGNVPNSRVEASIFTSGPQIRLQRSSPDRYGNIPYIELGVGASWLSKEIIGSRRMGMHFQFEDRAGAGLLWGPHQKYETSIRAFHYSNASLAANNSGMNVLVLSFGKWFD